MTELIERTKENWTWGIVNIPLLYGHNNRLGVTPKTIIRKFAHNAKCYKHPYYALDKSKRYLWYELDTTNVKRHIDMLNFFMSMNIDVYWHRTMKGYHYITLWLMDRADYEKHIDLWKRDFENGTFYYSLRIIPNKWKNEQKLWSIGDIVDNGSKHVKDLRYIQSAMEQEYFGYTGYSECANMLDNMFCLSRYSFSKRLKV